MNYRERLSTIDWAKIDWEKIPENAAYNVLDAVAAACRQTKGPCFCGCHTSPVQGESDDGWVKVEK